MAERIPAPPKVFTRDSFVVATPPLSSPVDSRPPSPSSAFRNDAPLTRSATASQYGFGEPSRASSMYASGSSTPAGGPSRSGSHSKDPLLKAKKSARAKNPLATLWDKLATVNSDAELARGRSRRPSASAEAGKKPTKRLRISRTFAQRALGYAMISLVGFNDSATGANLDSMREHYNVSYNVISTVFLSNIAGYFISCVMASFLTHHLGLGNVLLVAAFWMAAGCLTLALIPPFPGAVSALAMLGFGAGLYDAGLTSVVAHEENATTMALLYSFFAVGAVIASLLVGALLDRHVPWNLYYYIPMAIAITLAALGYPAFRAYEPPADEPYGEHGDGDIQLSSVTAASAQESDVVHGRARMSVQTRMKRTLSIKAVWVGFALIILAFGTGDTLSAWLVSFQVEKRSSPAAGARYQLAGLWAGIGLGRVVLGMVGTRMPEKTFAIAMLALASACLSVVWAVKHYVVDAVFLCIVGFFIGPVTPKVLSAVSARVPPSLKSTAMSFTIGLGLIGSGAGPLLFGFVAGQGWLGSLPAVLIVASAITCVMWLLLPRNDRRDE